jgi:hypothetical protein
MANVKVPLPVFRRFNTYNVDQPPAWLDDVFDPLNTFCEQTVNLLDKNLIIGDNVQGMKYTYTFNTLPTYTTGGFSPIIFNYTSNSQPSCAVVGKVVKSTGIPMLTAVTVSDWTVNLNKSPYQIVINYVTGLENSATYTITFLIL